MNSQFEQKLSLPLERCRLNTDSIIGLLPKVPSDINPDCSSPRSTSRKHIDALDRLPDPFPCVSDPALSNMRLHLSKVVHGACPKASVTSMILPPRAIKPSPCCYDLPDSTRHVEARGSPGPLTFGGGSGLQIIDCSGSNNLNSCRDGVRQSKLFSSREVLHVDSSCSARCAPRENFLPSRAPKGAPSPNNSRFHSKKENLSTITGSTTVPSTAPL